MSEVHITEHEGKMAGIRSISTSTQLNENCRSNAKIVGAICAKCYADALLEMRPGLKDCLEANQALLTGRILDDEELPVINPETDPYFRFESFGDLNNETQLINYINIVKKNPGVQFALWSKMYKLVYEYFKEDDHDCPENLNVLLSSLFVNKPIEISEFEKLGKFKPGQIKVFTVYDYSWLKDHPETVINCGSNNCFGCHQCYSKTTVRHILEVLKSDQGKYEKLLDWRDAGRRSKKVSSIFGCDDEI